MRETTRDYGNDREAAPVLFDAKGSKFGQKVIFLKIVALNTLCRNIKKFDFPGFS